MSNPISNLSEEAIIALLLIAENPDCEDAIHDMSSKDVMPELHGEYLVSLRFDINPHYGRFVITLLGRAVLAEVLK